MKEMWELLHTELPTVSGKKLSDQLTDGRFSGATRGPCIGHICPEAAEGGAIALLRNGDVIHIDIPNRKLNVELSATELELRKAVWEPVEILDISKRIPLAELQTITIRNLLTQFHQKTI